MPEQIVFLASFLLVFVGLVFMLVGWIHFRLLRLNPLKAIRTSGELVSFREYSATMRFGSNCVDYNENKPGRLPVLLINLDGRFAEISADWADYSLTSQDIGKQIPVLYQRKLGIIMIVDGEKPIHDYLQLKNIFFGVFLSIGVVLVVIGVIFANVF